MRIPSQLQSEIETQARALFNRGGGSVVAAVDQGTTSTRCILFNREGHRLGMSQLEHRQIMPRPGWVEHDPRELWANTRRVIADITADLEHPANDIAALGITNQRETTIVWDRKTGEPVYNAIVWQDTRTKDICRRLAEEVGAERITRVTGLPVSTYFSGPKVAWILDNVEGARERAERGELLFGTVDTWLTWNLTRRDGRALHVTDVTNASRTMLMNVETLEWDPALCDAMGIPMEMLPRIVSSSQYLGKVRRHGPVHGVPLAGILGDQQAATFGQACLEPGEAKNTYGTGNFLLLNTGTVPRRSDHGLITTVCYRIGDELPVYALEGSIAVTGSLVQWLRDNLGIIRSSSDVEALARTVDDNGGVYIVPAFSGLLAPHWRPDARGIIAGLTRYSTKGHIARAALEATAYQTREVVEAMNADSEVELTTLRVDGGMTVNDLLMQFQADILGVPVTRPVITETTSLGAAYAAGLAVGYWESTDQIREMWREDTTFRPSMTAKVRDALFARYGDAVARTLDWE